MTTSATFRPFQTLRTIVKAENDLAWDDQGKKYIDMHNGIAVNTVGACNPEVVKAVNEQAKKVVHLAATFAAPIQDEASNKLAVTFTPGSKVFWVNSGAEANENLIMFMRGAHYHNGHPEKYNIIAFEGCFHGRTIAMRALQGKFVDGIAPDGAALKQALGCQKAKFNDSASVEKLIDKNTAGIMVEPIQGEGGIIPATKEFLQGLRKLCDEKGIFLGFDEVQTGIGRTGKMWAHQHYGVLPDLMSSAKGLGGGFPVGALLISEKILNILKQKPPGNGAAFSAGTTFGGNPAVLAATAKVIDLLTTKDEYMGSDAKKRSDLFKEKLTELAAKYKASGLIKEVRGLGFFWGIVLGEGLKATELRSTLTNRGLLTQNAGETAIRLLPPVTISKKHILEAIQILDEQFAELQKK